MVVEKVDRDPHFEKLFSKLDNNQKEKVKTQIRKIIADPEVGKPMRYARKGTREVYVKPFRLSYAYVPGENKVIFLDLYHKDAQ
ncbi:MAG TPA: type II toxin-antitoxin system RelE/ParE family toxin [Candidatus Norongarragalinales archaeon]|jgi:mRNA-degrading endonuclease RelE of RelBE toxin-antitoxin system|nr:type II toxin-antitoxin system RelE/ParE family toxin [Candidatus Norongarragalinales archaeon]